MAPATMSAPSLQRRVHYQVAFLFRNAGTHAVEKSKERIVMASLGETLVIFVQYDLLEQLSHLPCKLRNANAPATFME